MLDTTTINMLDTKKVNQTAELIRAITHPLRIQILNFINANQKVNVNKIYGNLDLEQSITSQHLKVLRDNEVVYANKVGKYVIYEINYEKFKNFDKAVQKLVNY